jgi:hypothetical protein
VSEMDVRKKQEEFFFKYTLKDISEMVMKGKDHREKLSRQLGDSRQFLVSLKRYIQTKMMEPPEIVKPDIQVIAPSGEDPTLVEESHLELMQKYQSLYNKLDDQTIFSTTNNTTKYFATKADANREFRLGKKKKSCQLPTQSELMIQRFELNTPDLTRLMGNPVKSQSTREILRPALPNQETTVFSGFQR